MSRSNLIDVTVEVRHETQLALLVHDGDNEVWLPKSQIEVEETDREGIVVITMPEWLAIEKELI